MTIFTCNVGNVDIVHDPLQVLPGARYVCYTDTPFTSRIWDVRPTIRTLSSPKLTARYHKIMAPLTLEDDTIWVDAKIKLNTGMDFIPEHLVRCPILLYKHPVRDCIYDEARRVVALRKDDPIKVKRQIADYKDSGHPARWGLFETAVVGRRHTQAVSGLNESWWTEIESHSRRDQISLPFVLRRSGLDYIAIDGVRSERDFIVMDHPIVDYSKRIKLL